MSTESAPNTQPALSAELAEVIRQVPRADHGTTDSFDVKSGEGYSEKVVDSIEMIGEEQAAGFGERGPTQVTAAMRYLHSSRTIHQLVTDRNRAVGIYLAVASLLVTASSALLNASPRGDLMVALDEIQRWCFPITFAALAVLAVFVGFLLIRTRIGLIYEVAKMNALLGLPNGRVSRISPLSIFFIMQAFISLAGGFASGLFCIFMIHFADPHTTQAYLWATLVGAIVTLTLMLLYVGTVCYTTSDRRLQGLGGKQ
jgi:hypothetical protein